MHARVGRHLTGGRPAAADVCAANVEWAPLAALHQAGLVAAWGFLLQAPDLRLEACDLLRLLAARRPTPVRGPCRDPLSPGPALL